MKFIRSRKTKLLKVLILILAMLLLILPIIIMKILTYTSLYAQENDITSVAVDEGDITASTISTEGKTTLALGDTAPFPTEDNLPPVISDVTVNPDGWTNENVTITVTASDTGSGIAPTKGYSFNGGETWQTINRLTYTENTTGIKIKVKDMVGNVVTYGQTIDIDKIDKVAPTVDSVARSTAGWAKEVTLTVTATDYGSPSGIAIRKR